MSIPERAEEVFNRQNSYNCYFKYGKFGKSHESTFYSQNGLTKDQNRDTIKMRNVGCYTFYEEHGSYLRGLLGNAQPGRRMQAWTAARRYSLIRED